MAVLRLGRSGKAANAHGVRSRELLNGFLPALLMVYLPVVQGVE
jgi:hypothetical protein